MTYTIKNEAGEPIIFPSLAAYEAAEDWYNLSEKEDIIAYCKAKGADLVGEDGALIGDWHNTAMLIYAKYWGRA